MKSAPELESSSKLGSRLPILIAVIMFSISTAFVWWIFQLEKRYLKLAEEKNRIEATVSSIRSEFEYILKDTNSQNGKEIQGSNKPTFQFASTKPDFSAVEIKPEFGGYGNVITYTLDFKEPVDIVIPQMLAFHQNWSFWRVQKDTIDLTGRKWIVSFQVNNNVRPENAIGYGWFVGVTF